MFSTNVRKKNGYFSKLKQIIEENASTNAENTELKTKFGIRMIQYRAWEQSCNSSNFDLIAENHGKLLEDKEMDDFSPEEPLIKIS